MASFALLPKVERNVAMTKSLETINEVIKDPNHPFRKADDRPKKAQKNRYERRKIKEYLHVDDWLTEETA